jgi:hypothetical protein
MKETSQSKAIVGAKNLHPSRVRVYSSGQMLRPHAVASLYIDALNV